MPDKTANLDRAYALETPEDNRRLYADWAETYDATFAEDMDYQMPDRVAEIFAEAGRGKGPVLDVGAGTGLLVRHLPLRDGDRIDALDISPQMLAVAGRRGVYAKLIEADLTGPLDIADRTYGAIVSSGTFTHGHVGPDALDELLRIAEPGAIFVLAINREHFEARGFGDKFAVLEPHINDLNLRTVKIYGPNAQGPHKDDQALVAIFRKRGPA
jgi:SAM-dependent methyltransferase